MSKKKKKKSTPFFLILKYVVKHFKTDKLYC